MSNDCWGFIWIYSHDYNCNRGSDNFWRACSWSNWRTSEWRFSSWRSEKSRRRNQHREFRFCWTARQRANSAHGIESFAKNHSIDPWRDYKAASVIDSSVKIEAKVKRARKQSGRSGSDKWRSIDLFSSAIEIKQPFNLRDPSANWRNYWNHGWSHMWTSYRWRNSDRTWRKKLFQHWRVRAINPAHKGRDWRVRRIPSKV